MATATDLKNNVGRYLDTAQNEPVVIEKSGKAKAVLISIEQFEQYQALEDAAWARQADEAISDGFATTANVKKLLKRV